VLRLTRQQREREAWTRHFDGPVAKAPGLCSLCNAPIPEARQKRKLKTCSSACGKAAQTAKYGGARVIFNGREYPSKKQANMAAKLQALAASGAISNLKEEERITLVEGRPGLRGIFYYADFTWDDKDGHHVLDTKGLRTAVYQLKKQLAKLLHNITIEEV